MRASRILTAVVALAALGAVSPMAEAGGRRRTGGGFSGLVAAKPTNVPHSDEAILGVIANTPAGGTAVLPPGIFRTAIVIDRTLTLVGSPTGTVLDGVGLGRPIIEIRPGVAGVAIESLRLSGAGADGLIADGGNDRLAVRQVTVSASAGAGVRIVASSDVVLDRCTLDGNAGGGLDADGFGLRASRLALRSNGAAAATLRGKGAHLADSTFEGGALGIVFDGAEGSASRNTFRSVGLAARFAPTSDTCTFDRNDVRASAQGVVADLGSIYASIASNRFDRTTGDVIRLAGSWHAVKGNTTSIATGAGVVANGYSFQVEDNTISQTGAIGIAVTGPGNMVDGNTLSSTRGGAIDVQGDGNIVALNTSTGSGDDGIVIVGLMNRAIGNRILGARGEALAVAGDMNTLQSNFCQGASGNGIAIHSGTQNLVQTNTILLCGGVGLYDGGTATTLDHNKID